MCVWGCVRACVCVCMCVDICIKITSGRHHYFSAIPLITLVFKLKPGGSI